VATVVKRLKAFLVLLLVTFPGLGQAAENIPFWKLVGKCHAIVQGKIAVPVAAIREAAKNGNHQFVPMPVTVQQKLKGKDIPEEITLRYYTGTEQYGGVSREALIAQSGQEVVLFLLSSSKGYYLAAYSPKTIQAADDDLIRRIQSEMALQESQVDAFDRAVNGTIQPLDAEVHDLVERMVSPQIDPPTAFALYETLVEMGREAVPAIIKYMDDRRPLTIRKISFKVKDPDWEGIVHYGPEVVTDVMSVILSRITGVDLTQIYNGGSEPDRVNAVKLWKVYERRQAGKM
jgi:hypothetical protein